ncbi:MAG: Ig-like domain-containing protein [Kofleriaceae bacterium]
MRKLPAVLALFAFTACGDNHSSNQPDAKTGTDGPAPIDAPDEPDAPTDAPPVPNGIVEARATPDGTGLSLDIVGVTVTYLKPQIGSTTNDPAGFTIQAEQNGPALFVSVDPTTLTPAPAVGDVVSFQITTMGTVAMQRRAQAITGYARTSTGANVAALVQNVSAANDLVTALDNYDSELVTVTGTLGAFAASGSGFQRSILTTAGVSGDNNMQLRFPATLIDAIDLVETCQATATAVPFGRFNAQAQIGVYSASELQLTCPAPNVVGASALSSTSVRITFDRNVLATSVMADGSQFTFDNGLVASAATVAGRTVTVTTGAQTAGTTYTATVANTVKDLQGSAVATATAMFGGFVTPAVVRINELNANITNGCDLIELRVVSGGTMTGFKINQRATTLLEFPAFTAATNDLIVIHLNSGNASCNPGGAVSETTATNQQPASMFAANYDTAFDWYSTSSGLTATTNVFTLYNAAGDIIDALFAADTTTANVAGDTLTSAAQVAAVNQWSPAMASYDNTTFRAAAVNNLAGTGTSRTGTSLQRLDNTDDNDNADWTTGAGAAQTWGALNAGQTPL